MSIDRFEELLKELGQLINLPLHPDKHLVCRLNFDNLVHVQIEHDGSKERLLVATFVCEVPSGKFRENILKEALKVNSQFPRIGIFGFSERNNQLALFDYLPFQQMNGKKLADFLGVFVEKAVNWKQGVESGNIPTSSVAPGKSEHFFGLKT